MVAGDYAASFGLAGGRKDLDLIGDAAGGISGELLDGVRTLFDRAGQAGHDDHDIAAVYEALRFR
jgi:3-hydroxyisobutyrate dehydrogenase-like beta-hydroxyacid dehydrogenase